MTTDAIIRYNFLAQNLNALMQAENQLGDQVARTANILKSAELERVKHDIGLISKEVSKLHAEIFSDLQDEIGHEFKYLIKKKINGAKLP